MTKIKLILSVIIVFQLSIAYAQNSPDEYTDKIAEKLNFIRNEFERERFSATLWTCGWTVFNGGSAAYFYIKAAHANSKPERINNMIVGIGSNIAFIGNIATPLVSMYAPYFLHDMPENTSEEKAAKLKRAEDYLKNGSSLEEFGRSWISQSINVFTSAAGAFVIGAVYRDTYKKYGKNPDKEALIMFLECFLSGELQMLTQPMRLVSTQKKYSDKYGSSNNYQNNPVRFTVFPVEKGFAAGVEMSY